MSKLISKLPEDVRVVALQRQREETGRYWKKTTDELLRAFDWRHTIEGVDIWNDVDNGNYTPFREFHAKKQPETNGWISVEDRLPETGEEVLVYDCFGQLNEKPDLSMSSASYKNGMWYDYLGNIHFYGEDITHWQPLPEPPKN